MSSRLIAVAVLFASSVARVHAAPIIDWVTVGDAGNAADDTTYGAVADDFRIMEYEWTNSQYVEFLNAIDPQGGLTYGTTDSGSTAP